ncbi:hypothetical protein EVAR_10992_1 [Eumeta japonica]|uniref:Uncharacterized protein n=1 Tax=Eumeta variegata TaxID=151549 RepID=A0A4C1YHP5_EUMVA|nr:hypothetical protein EVAR_10992_1 [Eumeta japonica]
MSSELPGERARRLIDRPKNYFTFLLLSEPAETGHTELRDTSLTDLRTFSKETGIRVHMEKTLVTVVVVPSFYILCDGAYTVNLCDRAVGVCRQTNDLLANVSFTHNERLTTTRAPSRPATSIVTDDVVGRAQAPYEHMPALNAARAPFPIFTRRDELCIGPEKQSRRGGRCVRPLSLFYSDVSVDGVEDRSLVPRSRSHARLRWNATLSHAFSCVQPASSINKTLSRQNKETDYNCAVS